MCFTSPDRVGETLSCLYQARIEPPKAARGHATHIDGIVLNVTKFRIQILCSLHCAMGRSTRTIEVRALLPPSAARCALASTHRFY